MGAARLCGAARGSLAALVLAACAFSSRPAPAYAPPERDKAVVLGRVVNEMGQAVADADVRLKQDGQPKAELVTRSNGSGDFVFRFLEAGSYRLSAAKSGVRSEAVSVDAREGEDAKPVVVVLKGAQGQGKPAPGGGSSSDFAPEFSDKPNFTVAGVTDWTAVGGHGSDTTLRASETLARETQGLKTGATPTDAAGTGGEAEKHRLAGEAAERDGDALTAVRELELAAHLEPSEENTFAWGSELLLHRAIWQAQEVLSKGAAAYPRSVRMLTALGAAMFAGARYQDAAERLCAASDLDPAARAPYEFMGKVQMGAPDPLPCIEERLQRFVERAPASSEAYYLYAMALQKRQDVAPDEYRGRQIRGLLTKAVSLDPKCGEGYLQLGVLSASERDYAKAVELYAKAIAADPRLEEAHYRLGVAYDRLGEHEKAQAEFAVHERLKKEEADEVERERKEVKQFQVVQPGSGAGVQ
jgi:tetratricopeptide (TPR) repeat protein